jgi:serine/threonine-protein kinase RsbW
VSSLPSLRELSSRTIEVVPAAGSSALRSILELVDTSAASDGGDPSDWFDVKLAVEEVCTNLIEHAFGSEGGTVELTIAADAARIVASVRDTAPPFPPDAAPLPDLDAPLEQRAIGGLGWHLVRQLVDSIEYKSNEHEGNQLTLVRQRRSRKE